MPNNKQFLKSAELSPLGQARVAQGWTQSELARRVGVSRQFLNQVEAGRTLPNVAVALRLAAVLERTVEGLFATAAEEAGEQVDVVPAGGAIALSSRVWLGRVGRTWVAHPADTANTMASGFAVADGVLVEPRRVRLLVESARITGNILVAGCDPALALIEAPTGDSAEGLCHWIDRGSGEALELLATGRVHVAGIHYAGAEGAGNLAEVRRRDRGGAWSVYRFSRWEQGWMVARGRGPTFGGVTDLGGGAWRLINRGAATAARRWLDDALQGAGIGPARIPGYGEMAASAHDAALAIVAGRADVTVGPQAVAMAHGLDFVPTEAVDFDLVAPAVWWRGPAGQALRARLRSLQERGAFAGLPGYVASAAGEERARVNSRR